MTRKSRLRNRKAEAAYAGWQARHCTRAASRGPRGGGEGESDGFRPRATPSGIPLPELFTPTEEMLSPEYYLERIGFPGELPFTRGIHATMYRGRRWTMRQYAGFGTAEETNARYRYLLAHGTTGLSVAFDLPTQMGRDSDDPLSEGEVGRVGVAIDSIEDMEILFRDIRLDEVSTSMTINSTAHILLALYLGVAKRRGIDWKRLRGTVQNDVLKEYIARGTYIYPPNPALKITSDIFEFCSEQVPAWNTISISGYHIREAGSTAVQEVAFALANGIAYLQSAVERGLAVDTFAPRVTFFFNCHNNFLEEIAKFRAARRLWAKILTERFGATRRESLMLRFHTQTAGSSLTAQEPLVNIVRTSIQALAAVLGGTQSLHTNGYDEAISLPSEEAALLALRTQQVIASESGVADVVDPFGGSYCIETLTDEIERRAEELIDRIDDAGGMVEAISVGFPQREIEEAAFRYQQQLERREIEVVGVNVHEEASLWGRGREIFGGRAFTVRPECEAEQRERVRALRARRNPTEYARAMQQLDDAVSGGGNLMPAVCGAVEAYATVGEISNLFRRRFGEYHGG